MTSSVFDFATSDASSSGVYLVTHVDLVSIDAAASHAGWTVCKVNLLDCIDRVSAFMRIGRALAMPGLREGGWDTLVHGIADLSWMPAPGYAVLFDYADELRALSPDDFSRLLDVFDDAASAWSARGVAFWTFFALHESAFETEEE